MCFSAQIRDPDQFPEVQEASKSTARLSHPMDWKQRSTCGDKFTWRCPNCNAMKSIRNESFLTKSKLTYKLGYSFEDHMPLQWPFLC